MSSSDQNGGAAHDGDVTQGENPGAQGDFGAGQGDSGENGTPQYDPTVDEDALVEGDEQPRRVTSDDDGDGTQRGAHGVDDDDATSDDLEHAADERQDAGAAPAQPEAPG